MMTIHLYVNIVKCDIDNDSLEYPPFRCKLLKESSTVARGGDRPLRED